MEGPSLKILREELRPFLSQKVKKVSGNSKQPIMDIQNCLLERVDTWGKNIFLIFSQGSQKIVTKTHFMMFGSYRINEPKENRSPRLQLKFKNGIVYFYSCSLRLDADEYWRSVDREVDVMSPLWDVDHVVECMSLSRDEYLCDLFLDQGVFAGSGNIVKNEVLFNLRKHPLTRLSSIPKKEWKLLANAIHSYCWNFYRWKKKFELRQHWQVYRKSKCPLCDQKLRIGNMGERERRTFYCPRHQKRSRTRLTLHQVLPLKKTRYQETRLDH